MNKFSASQIAAIKLLVCAMKFAERECLNDSDFEEWLNEQDIFSHSIGDILPTIGVLKK